MVFCIRAPLTRSSSWLIRSVRRDMADVPTTEELLECLRRSGYLLESRLVAVLQGLDHFVEPNSSYLDKATGVSREIDIIAELHRYDRSRAEARVCVKTTLIIEAVNNPLPAVLLTPVPFTPNTSDDDFIPFCITPAAECLNHPFANEVHLPVEKAKTRDAVFSQFCGFTKKKSGGDLMALHPEDLYGSLRKAAECALTLRDQSANWMDASEDGYCRIFQWRPAVVLGGDLYVFEEDKLRSVRHAHLLFNFHFEGTARSVLIDILTERELPALATRIAQEDNELEARLYELTRSMLHCAERSASPNGGPAAQSGGLGASKGPPSVS